jgi:hypothetical protein
MNNNQNKNFTENAKKVLKENGINTDKINGDRVNSLLENLSVEDKNKINNLLNDKKALESVLNSDKAKALMKMFGVK